jgi:hypothetical protein
MGFIKKTNSFLLSGQVAKARNSGNYQGVLQELTQKNFNTGNHQGVKDLFLAEMRFHSGKSRPVLLAITRNRSDYLYLLFIASLELCIELYGKVDIDSLSNYVGQKDFLRNVGPANDSFAFLVKIYELLEASNMEVPVHLLKSLQSLISKEQEVLRVMEEFQQM